MSETDTAAGCGEKKIRVAVIDDHGVFRLGLKFLLREAGDMELAGERDTGEGALEFLRECRADVLLLDVRMPGIDGLATLKAIRESNLSGLKVVMLTTSSLEEDISSAVRLHADGYIVKDLPPEELLSAIRSVVAGRRYLPAEVVDLYARHMSLPEITPREREVLSGMARGLSNAQMARAMGVTAETIKMHVRNIFGKLAVGDRTEAVVVAAKRGILKV